MGKSIRKKQGVLQAIDSVIIDLPAPKNISYLWGYGSLIGVLLTIQIVSGVLLAMHYIGHIEEAFKAVGHITRDIKGGHIIRYMHSNGATILFIGLYIHIGRGLYYGGYRQKIVWVSGVLLYIIMMATAFIGYVLPWGQMSYWAATVITSLFTAIPYIGVTIVEWLWGGYSVGGATLGRFYSIHYLLPFIGVGVVVIHIVGLHKRGSSNPLGIRGDIGKIVFYPYYIVKDIYGIIIGLGIIGILCLLLPNGLIDAENNKEANGLITPEHIQPEWYFLYIYALLRAIPNKAGGVVALVGGIIVIVLWPWLMGGVREQGLVNKPISRLLYWGLIGDIGLLTWVGSKVVEEPYIIVGQIGAVYYFIYNILLGPLVGKIEERAMER